MSSAIQSAIESLHPNYGTEFSDVQFPTIMPKTHPTDTMMAARWYGNQDIRVETVPKPMITDPKDALIRITTTTVCGSDLHLYHNEFSGLQQGDIMGHEGVGIVQEVGPECHSLQKGDRVVVSFCISCGECMYCKEGRFTLCDCTNPSSDMNKMYGARLAGIFGYSHLLGGYPGMQAEYVRVPFADVNCLKLPEEITNDTALLLSDIACTAWHANELCEVQEGDEVAVWGLGPVGLLACMWAQYRGAARVIGIDHVKYRLDSAIEHLGIETINFDEGDPVKALQAKVSHGPNKCIDASGFRFSKGIVHKIERAVRLETDMSTSFNECVLSCRKGGIVGLIADYYGYSNHVNLGALMEKQLTVRGGQCFVQRYWKDLLHKICDKEVDPTFVITHHLPLEDAAKAYDIFDNYKDNAIKIILHHD